MILAVLSRASRWTHLTFRSTESYQHFFLVIKSSNLRALLVITGSLALACPATTASRRKRKYDHQGRPVPLGRYRSDENFEVKSVSRIGLNDLNPTETIARPLQ
jgi:hypothetical protein